MESGDFSDGCVRRTEFNCGIKEEKHGFIEGYVPISYLSAFLQSQTLESEFDESTLLTFDFFPFGVTYFEFLMFVTVFDCKFYFMFI